MVISIVALLVGLLIPALGKARASAAAVRELAAGQQLIAAYLLYADDHKGSVLPGYAPSEWVQQPPIPGLPSLNVVDETGEIVSGVPAQRYPWRLAPYLDFNFAGLYKNDRVLKRYRERSDFQYIISLSPSFGLNSVFLGGDSDRFGFDSFTLRNWGSFYITRIDQPRNPTKLAAFVTCKGVNPDGGELVPGYFRADPPFTRIRVWLTSPPEANPSAQPGQYGNVDYRLGGKAATIQVDGHAEMNDFRALDDMRRWADRASNATWTIGSN